MTQAQLAEQIDVTPGHIGHLERREREPSFAIIDRFCRVAGITAGEMFCAEAPSPDGDGMRREIDGVLIDRSDQDLRLVLGLLRALFADLRLNGRPLRKSRRAGA